MPLAIRGDRLLVRTLDAIATVTVRTQARIRGLKSGRVQNFSVDFTTTNDRVAALHYGLDDQGRPVEEDSEVVSATSAVLTGDPNRGQVYVDFGFTSAAGLGVALGKGYVYTGHNVAMGEFTEPGPGGGEGYMRSISLGDPAAGADYADQTVPTNALWKLRGFAGTLVAAAGAANREFHINITDATNIVGGGHAVLFQTASETILYLGGNTPQVLYEATGTTIGVYLPDCDIPEAYVIDFVTDAIVAGDNWGAGRLYVEEWLVE